MNNHRGLYAWTTRGLYLSQFLIERSKKRFNYKKIDISMENFSEFLRMNTEKELIDIPLYDGQNEYNIIGTRKEEFQLNTAIEIIQDKITESQIILNSMITPKELDKILDLVKLSNNDQLEINSFQLFYKLFIYTFRGKMEVIPFEQQLDLVTGQVEY
jgi:hypothetical protein